MTRLWTALLTLLVLTLGFTALEKTSANAPASQETDKDAITKLLSQQQDAWNRGDVDAFMQAYWHSPELTFSGSSGISRGWDGVLARYKKAYPDRAAMGQLDFSELEFHLIGPDAALMLGTFHLKREKDEPRGTFSLVWQRFPEGWRIVHDHTTAFPEKH
jgi:beta-aspartyl-peptidase (threonine type)